MFDIHDLDRTRGPDARLKDQLGNLVSALHLEHILSVVGHDHSDFSEVSGVNDTSNHVSPLKRQRRPRSHASIASIGNPDLDPRLDQRPASRRNLQVFLVREDIVPDIVFVSAARHAGSGRKQLDVED